MNRSILTRAGWPALLLAAWMPAQSLPTPSAGEPTAADMSLVGQFADEMLMPLRAHPEDPNGPLWTAGESWKARFAADSFTFFPWLGPDAPRNLPLRWESTGLRVGEEERSLEAADELLQCSATRVEIDRGAIVERYDIVVAGVEQSFILAEPLGGGDVIVSGRIASELRATPRRAAHGALTFVDPIGRQVLTYGAAFVFDAAGRRAPIATAFDGDRIELVVPGAWLADARYPVTIDPLTSPVLIYEWNDGVSGVRSIAIGRSEAHNERMMAFSRRFAADDHDTYIRVMNDNFGSRQTVHFDVTNDHDTLHVALDFVAGADRWVAVYDDGFLGRTRLMGYFHDGGVGTSVPGTLSTLLTSPIFNFQTPSFGGTTDTGDSGFLAWRRDLVSAGGNSETSRVYGAMVNASARTIGVAALLNASTNTGFDSELPCVSRQSRLSNGWMVVWQEFDPANPNDDWDIIGMRVRADGTRSAFAAFGNHTQNNWHKTSPQVAGTGNSFVLTYLSQPNSGNKPNGLVAPRLESQNFIWNANSAAPTRSPPALVLESNHNWIEHRGSGASAYDFETRSHCAIVYRVQQTGLMAARLGYDGHAAETVQLVANGSNLRGAVCFDRAAGRFGIAHADSSGARPVVGQQLVYGAASASSYGSSCAGTLTALNQGPRNLPFLGSRSFAIRVTGARPNAATWLYAAAGPADLALPSAGPGCRLLLEPSIALIPAGSLATDATGARSFPMPLPSTAPPVNLFWQVLQLDQGLLWTSSGLLTELR